MTDVKNISDLMSKVDAACVFARSQSMRRLLNYLEHPNGTVKGVAMITALSIGGFALGGVAAGLEWLPGNIAAALSAVSIFGVPLSCVAINLWRFERYKKQAQDSGICVIKNADQPPTAVVKMRIIDAYESCNVSAEQLTMLKSLAQREDIPAGWWENAAQLIKQYQEDQKASDEVRTAQQRLAALSTVSVAPIHAQNMDACSKTRQTDPPRLMV